MNDYPPITGKLRELVADVNWHEITDNIGGPWLDSWHRAMRDRCDTIDAIHARLEAAYDRLRAEGDSMAAALDAAQGEHDFAPESHYMMLPKDADGVPIHVGDTVTCGRSVWQVTGLRLTGAAWGVCCTIFNDHGGSGTNVYPPCDLRHYHNPDTWERIIEDALLASGDMNAMAASRTALVARCKALAGDAE